MGAGAGVGGEAAVEGYECRTTVLVSVFLTCLHPCQKIFSSA